ncbi:TrmH family RNA methyltransferase [Patescibacteria group bacterium]|nr:TrmH family RNA methyltransferase [Patescibacteria group bacterium]
MKKLNAKQLRVSEPTEEDLKKINRNPIYLVLDQIIDTYNIGSLFRLADAIAVEKVYLCGDMETPPNSRIHKSAVGTENWTPWEKTDSTLKTVKMLNEKGVHTIAIEQDRRSVSYTDLKPNFPCAIIAGNEIRGLPKEVVDEANTIIELPMCGINNSFNVWGTTAVVAYKVLENLKETI